MKYSRESDRTKHLTKLIKQNHGNNSCYRLHLSAFGLWWNCKSLLSLCTYSMWVLPILSKISRKAIFGKDLLKSVSKQWTQPGITVIRKQDREKSRANTDAKAERAKHRVYRWSKTRGRCVDLLSAGGFYGRRGAPWSRPHGSAALPWRPPTQAGEVLKRWLCATGEGGGQWPAMATLSNALLK